jgi:hypothetical protein
MAWDPWSTPFDTVVIAGQTTPGVATITGCERLHKYDVVAGYGASGGATIYRGSPPIPFGIEIRLNTPEEYAAWGDFRNAVLKPPSVGPNSKALDVFHPFLAELGVSSCVIEKVSVPENDGTGVWTVKISAIEWRRLKLTLANPEAAKGKTEEPETPTVKYINQLTNQLQRLADQ